MPQDANAGPPRSDSEGAETKWDGAFHHHLGILRLVHPPMTNREADYDRTEEELRPAFAKASLYGIAQRAELTILNLERDAKRPWVLWICLGEANSTLRCCGQVDLACFSGFTPDDFELEIGTVAPDRPYWGYQGLAESRGRRVRGSSDTAEASALALG